MRFAKINEFTRMIMTPFLYFAIKSLYKKNGENLGKIMWCDDEEIKPYFIAAGKSLTYGNMRRQLADSLVNKPLPPLDENLQRHTFFEFGSMPDKNKTNLAKTPPFSRFLSNSRLKYVWYVCTRLYQKSSKISTFWLLASLTADFQDKTRRANGLIPDV